MTTNVSVTLKSLALMQDPVRGLAAQHGVKYLYDNGRGWWINYTFGVDLTQKVDIKEVLSLKGGLLILMDALANGGNPEAYQALMVWGYTNHAVRHTLYASANRESDRTEESVKKQMILWDLEVRRQMKVLEVCFWQILAGERPNQILGVPVKKGGVSASEEQLAALICHFDSN